MTKTIISILLLTIPAVLVAQQKKVDIGIYGSPDYYNYGLSDVGDGFDDLRSYSKIFNGAVGLSIRYKIKNKLVLRSGIGLSFKGYRFTSTRLGVDPIGTRLYELRNSDGANVTVSMGYLELPLQILYQFHTIDNLSIYGSLGFVLSNKLSKIYNDSKVGKSLEKNAPNLVRYSSLGFGIEYNFLSWLSVFIEPNFAYYFDQLDTTNMDQSANSFGVRLGWNFSI